MVLELSKVREGAGEDVRKSISYRGKSECEGPGARTQFNWLKEQQGGQRGGSNMRKQSAGRRRGQAGLSGSSGHG